MDIVEQVAVLAGLAALALAMAMFGYRLWFRSRALEAQGEVIDDAAHEAGADIDGGRPVSGPLQGGWGQPGFPAPVSGARIVMLVGRA